MKSDICNDGYTREFPRLSLSPRQANNIALVTRYLFFVGHINCFIKTLFYGVGASFCQTSKFLAWIEVKVFKQSQQFLFLELTAIGPIVGLSWVCLLVCCSVGLFMLVKFDWVWYVSGCLQVLWSLIYIFLPILNKQTLPHDFQTNNQLLVTNKQYLHCIQHCA